MSDESAFPFVTGLDEEYVQVVAEKLPVYTLLDLTGDMLLNGDIVTTYGEVTFIIRRLFPVNMGNLLAWVAEKIILKGKNYVTRTDEFYRVLLYDGEKITVLRHSYHSSLYAKGPAELPHSSVGI